MPTAPRYEAAVVFCIREDSIRFPRAEAYSVEYRASANLNAAFHTRLLPTSNLGVGHSSTIKKAHNCANDYMMESASPEDFDQKRKSVRGFTGDQGAERGIPEETVKILPGYRDKYRSNDPMNFMWPWALYVIGHLHLLFNALEEACKSASIAEKFFDSLQDVCSFLNDQDLRRKFMHECCPNEAVRKKFVAFHKRHIDWRWEFLCDAINGVLDIWADLCAYYDYEKMSKSESGKLDRKVLRAVQEVINDKMFVLIANIFLAVGRVVEKFASRLEGCHCHSEIWKKEA